jgi:hypothetical protein
MSLSLPLPLLACPLFIGPSQEGEKKNYDFHMLEPTPNKNFKNSVIARVYVPYPFLMGPCQKKKIN